MRTLSDIQADIEYVLKKKANFFTRWFDAESGRLEDLRKEEFNCLDMQLLETDSSYAALAAANRQCFEGLETEFKVTELSHATYGNVFSGEINLHGFAYCERASGIGSRTFSNKSSPRVLTGAIDHFGRIGLEVVQSDATMLYPPKAYAASISANGDLKVERTEEAFELTYDTQLVSMAGDFFHGAESKRKAFLKTRQQLHRILEPHRIPKE